MASPLSRKIGLELSPTTRVRTGDKQLSANTLHSYKKHYDSLFRFTAMIGSYDTCFVLSYNAPTQFCPSMDAKTVALYIYYKTKAKGESLFRSEQTDQPVKDVCNQPVLCTGDWKDPGNIIQFVAAVSRIHSSLKQEGQYFDTCDDCVTMYNSHRSSCRFHPNQFLIYNKGNPQTSDIVENAVHAGHKLCSGHVVKGAEYLLPSEIRDIRTALTGTGNPSYSP
jgi:hypothetical protein